MTASTTTWQRLRLVAIAAAVALMMVAILGLRSELAAAGPGPVAHASATKSVTINGFAFHPPTLSVGKGSSVTFSNTSSVSHTATRAGSFDTGVIKAGHSKTIVFKHAGTFAYHCTIHPTMHGKIVVH